MSIGIFLFWFSVLVIAYTYFLFPVVLVLRNLIWPQHYHSADITPRVSMIVAVYNEIAVIEEKLNNILSLDYPKELFEAIIVSDGSDDGTNEIVQRFTNDTIKFLPLPRQGKAPALNAGVEASSGEILVFSDANSIYQPDAIRALTRPFADPKVGGVAGNQQYISAKNTSAAGERGYWGYDRVLKLFESRGGNTISATGAIYAIRRSLFQPISGGTSDDFVISTRVIAQGSRLIFSPDAIASEPPAKVQSKEFARKVRIMTHGLNAVVEMRTLLNPLRYGFYSIQLFTHKVMRRLLFIPLIVLFLINPFLLDKGLFYQLTFLAQIGFYTVALLAWGLEKRGIRLPKLLMVPAYICMVYLAALFGTVNLIRGHKIDKWTSTHSAQ
jgi:cellulose synthase/poly-beta-1,6-N-acetylglucosamine synthase-like glycosyltransferase